MVVAAYELRPAPGATQAFSWIAARRTRPDGSAHSTSRRSSPGQAVAWSSRLTRPSRSETGRSPGAGRSRCSCSCSRSNWRRPAFPAEARTPPRCCSRHSPCSAPARCSGTGTERQVRVRVSTAEFAQRRRCRSAPCRRRGRGRRSRRTPCVATLPGSARCAASTIRRAASHGTSGYCPSCPTMKGTSGASSAVAQRAQSDRAASPRSRREFGRRIGLALVPEDRLRRPCCQGDARASDRIVPGMALGRLVVARRAAMRRWANRRPPPESVRSSPPGWASAMRAAKLRPRPTPAMGLSKCIGSTAGTQVRCLSSISTRGIGTVSCGSTLPRPAMFDWPTSRNRCMGRRRESRRLRESRGRQHRCQQRQHRLTQHLVLLGAHPLR